VIAQLIAERDQLTELAALGCWEFAQVSAIKAYASALDDALLRLCGR